MPKNKNYQISEHRAVRVVADEPRLEEPTPCAQDARIDMVVLLGPGTRFGGAERVLDLRDWLDRGIDGWVFATAACLKAMLLSGTRETKSVATYFNAAKHLFCYVTERRQIGSMPMAQAPSDLSPLHIQHFVGWLKKLAESRDWRPATTHSVYKSVKAVVLEMFAQGFIPGESALFFPRSAQTLRDGETRQTSLSDAEQERLAKAIKSDLVDIHHGRLTLAQSAVQALRLLVVAHRQGLNLTPLLEMRRDALMPGLLPGTVLIVTAKYRSKKIHSRAGRAAVHKQPTQMDLLFDLSEGAVLQQAIASTQNLVAEAPSAIKERVWLYRAARAKDKGRITCLSTATIPWAIGNLIRRHQLLGDDGKPLRLNLARLRKSFFDRALRAADGDLAITANLLGNTPSVAGMNYPSMNDARQAEAADFLNGEYTALMRAKTRTEGIPEIRPIQVRPSKGAKDRSAEDAPAQTPVSGCKDTISGEHAPNDGVRHCDRYVMAGFKESSQHRFVEHRILVHRELQQESSSPASFGGAH